MRAAVWYTAWAVAAVCVIGLLYAGCRLMVSWRTCGSQPRHLLYGAPVCMVVGAAAAIIGVLIT